MKPYVVRGSIGAFVVLAIIVGCTADFGNNGGGDTTGGGTAGADVDTGFSDAPTSPGGTGGTGVPGDTTDDGGTIELPAEETRSFFTAFQVDPVPEDTAGPKFVVSGDVDQDGLLDLVSGWNQSQPVQLHLQRRDPAGNISFRTINLGGTTPIAVMAGVELGFINDDEFPDVVVLVKANGQVGLCPTQPPSEISSLVGEVIVLFNPGSAALVPDGDRWTLMELVNPFVQDRWIYNHFPGAQTVPFDESQTKPERAGFTALAVGNLDGVPGDEIVVALNPGECEELGQKPPTNTVDLWINPGGAAAEDSSAWGVPADFALSRGVPLAIMSDAPEVTDVAIYDVEGDGDLDVVAAWSNSLSLNIRWVRNPLIPDGRDALIEGTSDPNPNVCSGGTNDGSECDTDDDCPGIPDGSCVAGFCVGGASNGGACAGSSDCQGTDSGTCVAGKWRFYASNWEQRPVGQVDTDANIITIGDVDTDGFDDVVVRSTIGQLVQWFRRPSSLTLPPEFPPNDPVPDRTNFPWPVFTLTEFTEQEPEAISLGDVTGDGQNELMVAVEGGVFWLDGTVGTSVYDPWFSNAIIQDNEPDSTDPTQAESEVDPGDQTTPGGTGVGVTANDSSTHINALLVVDLDGDGRNDIVGTLDRRSGSGLSDDRLVWYRNIRTEE